MRMISVRDFRTQSAQVWRDLAKEKDLVVTSNGKPIGVLSSMSGESLEDSLAILRRARAMFSVTKMQMKSAKEGRDKITLDEINEEISNVRKNRPK